MKAKRLFSLYAVVSFTICVNFLVIPEFWIELYGASPDPQPVFLYRLIAVLFGGMGVMAWAGRTAGRSPSRDAMVVGMAMVNGLATAVALSGAMAGVYNRFAWGTVVMFGLFTIGFTYIAKRRASGSRV